MPDAQKLEKDTRKDTLLDFNGLRTGMPMNKMRTIVLLVVIAISVLFWTIGPAIGLESHKAGLALGWTVGVVVLYISQQFSLFIGCLMINIGGILLGLVEYRQVTVGIGNSPFAQMLGMFIVSMGAAQTPFAKRIAYFFLIKFGKSQPLMLLGAFLATTVVSAFVADTASTIIMASIFVGLLEEIGAEKGKSSFGKAMMLLVPAGAYLGGMALISGSPGMNVLGISTMENATGGQFTITYRDWAVIGIPAAILLAIPTWYTYIKYFGVTKEAEKEIDPNYFKMKMAELGPITGSEIRWIATVIFMVICMVTGIMPMMVTALLCAFITIFPMTGTVTPQNAMKGLPVEIVLMNAFIPTLGTIFANWKIGEWVTGPFVPLLKGLNPLVLMLVISYTMGILNNIFANASAGVIALVIAAFSPLCVELGFNPSLMMLPAIILGSLCMLLGTASCVLLTYGYGYWSMKDPLIPGSLLILFWPLVISLVAYIVGPLFGIPLYIQ